MGVRKPPFRFERIPRIHRRAPAELELTRWERVGGVLLWWVLPAVALSLVVVYMALAVVWHANPPAVPVLGTSMQPTLHAGDLVLIRGVPPKQLRKGDVIAFHVPKDIQEKYGVPASYVHRIVKVATTSHGFQYRTRGDNVPGPDPFWTFSENVVGKMVVKVPGGGYPVLFFRSKQGKIFAIALVAVLFLYFVLGVWERRQEVEESNALTMAEIVAEARALRDSMASVPGAARAPPPAAVAHEPTPLAELYAAAAAAGLRMVEVAGEAPDGATLCSRGCHVLLPGAHFDPHTGDMVGVPDLAAEPDVESAAEEAKAEAETLAGPAVSEPEYVPVWERDQPSQLAEYELAPAYREDDAAGSGDAHPVAPLPSSRALVPYVGAEPSPIDFERLEREIHEAARSSADVRETMQELVGAIGEYGEHLRSHTAVMQALAATTGDLQASTAEMRQFLASLAAVLQALVAAQQDAPPPDAPES